LYREVARIGAGDELGLDDQPAPALPVVLVRIP
jgi:hypothetical protein